MVNVRRPEPATSILDASSFSTPNTTPSLQRTPTAVPLFSSACRATGWRNGGAGTFRPRRPTAPACYRHLRLCAALPAGCEPCPRGASAPPRARARVSHLVCVLHLVQLAVGAVRGDRLVVLHSVGAGAVGGGRQRRYCRQLSRRDAFVGSAGRGGPRHAPRCRWTTWLLVQAPQCGAWSGAECARPRWSPLWVHGGLGLPAHRQLLRPRPAHDVAPAHTQLTLLLLTYPRYIGLFPRGVPSRISVGSKSRRKPARLTHDRPRPQNGDGVGVGAAARG